MLFGDAGTATLLEYTDELRPSFFITGTRGTCWNKLIAPAGGYSLPMFSDIAGLEITDATGNVWRLCDDIMKGLDVFKFTTDVGPKGIKDILEFSGKSMEYIDYFAFHQANSRLYVLWPCMPEFLGTSILQRPFHNMETVVLQQ